MYFLSRAILVAVIVSFFCFNSTSGGSAFINRDPQIEEHFLLSIILSRNVSYKISLLLHYDHYTIILMDRRVARATSKRTYAQSASSSPRNNSRPGARVISRAHWNKGCEIYGGVARRKFYGVRVTTPEIFAAIFREAPECGMRPTVVGDCECHGHTPPEHSHAPTVVARNGLPPRQGGHPARDPEAKFRVVKAILDERALPPRHRYACMRGGISRREYSAAIFMEYTETRVCRLTLKFYGWWSAKENIWAKGRSYQNDERGYIPRAWGKRKDVTSRGRSFFASNNMDSWCWFSS